MPLDQFHRVKQKSKSQSREFRRRSSFSSHSLHKKRCDQKSDAWSLKRPSKSKVISARLLAGLSTKQPEIQKAMEMLAEVEETSRAKSIWFEESNQIATVLNSILQFKIPAHMLNRSRNAQEINKHVSDGVNEHPVEANALESQRSERLQQIRSSDGRCRGHTPARDFKRWERDSQEPRINRGHSTSANFDFGQFGSAVRSRNWPKSKLAEVELGRSRIDLHNNTPPH